MEAHQVLVEDAVQRVTRVRQIGRIEAVARRLLDILVAVTTLAFLSPAIVIAAVAIMLDSPGPVVFRQRRIGRNMKPFTVLKFRTMQSDADSAVHRDYTRRLIGGRSEPSRGGLFKLAGDRRVTRVGHILRQWSFDEVPQLVNVLRGEMSLVGPRPVLEYEVEQYPNWWLRRFAVKPGLTGLWQVSGRNERTYEEMVQLDIDYAERRTLGLDLQILIKTVWVVLRRKGVA